MREDLVSVFIVMSGMALQKQQHKPSGTIVIHHPHIDCKTEKDGEEKNDRKQPGKPLEIPCGGVGSTASAGIVESYHRLKLIQPCDIDDDDARVSKCIHDGRGRTLP